MAPRNYSEMAKKSWLNRTKPHKGGFSDKAFARKMGSLGGQKTQEGQRGKKETDQAQDTNNIPTEASSR